MNKKIASIIVFAGLICSASSVLAAPCPANQICNPLSVGTIPALLGKISYQVGLLVASLGVIMIIVAGIFYLTSAGSPERITTAKKALIYAIVGIAIGVAASTIATIVCDVIGTTC